MKRYLIVGLLLLSGCSNKPELKIEEHKPTETEELRGRIVVLERKIDNLYDYFNLEQYEDKIMSFMMSDGTIRGYSDFYVRPKAPKQTNYTYNKKLKKWEAVKE